MARRLKTYQTSLGFEQRGSEAVEGGRAVGPELRSAEHEYDNKPRFLAEKKFAQTS
jgi:hypothetical protein